MLIRAADWKRPTDAAYAFRLRAARAPGERPGGFVPAVPERGTTTDIRDVARVVLADGEAERFAERVRRWSGPENVIEGEKPYEGLQHEFEERASTDTLALADLDLVLRGRVLVLREERGQADYVLRDHHMLDVALYHYRTTGDLPRGLFHADRHSDWCRDSFLAARTPEQAATWWALFPGLKRPDDGSAVLEETDVFFATAKAQHTDAMTGRTVAPVVPGSLAPGDSHWERALEREGATEADWVSLDLDCFQPAPQLAVTRGLLRDARLHAMMRRARVRVFVLSPQFMNGGDKIAEWEVNGSVHSSLRLLNVLRNLHRNVRVAG